MTKLHELHLAVFDRERESGPRFLAIDLRGSATAGGPTALDAAQELVAELLAAPTVATNQEGTTR